MPDLVTKDIEGIFGTKNHIKNQIRKYIRTEQEIRKILQVILKYA